MKKLIAALLLTATIAIPLMGCSPENSASSADLDYSDDTDGDTASLTNDSDTDILESSNGVIEIREKMFVAQTNDVYINYEDYLGKTFSYEGIFTAPEYDGRVLYQVIRYGPGCCGYDANAGFEVSWDGGYPDEDDWVKVIGVLDLYEEDGFEYLVLNLSSIEVLDKRGAEYVTQ